MSGSVTISNSGVPARFRSTAEKVAEWCGVLAGVFFEVGPQDADFFGAAVFDGNFDIAVLAERQVVLADLVILRQVGVVIALAIPFGEGGDLAVQGQPGQDGVFQAVLFITGSVPGIPMQTGQTCVLAVSP